MPIRVLFVCLGNICRSPTAHGVFQAMVDAQGLGEQILVDSAGTAAWHEGKAPDPRSCDFAARRGYDLAPLRARQALREDFERFDYILAMDSENLSNLKQLQPDSGGAQLSLLLQFSAAAERADVPDPYYGNGQGFDLVLDLIEDACTHLLSHIKKEHGLSC